MTSNGLSDNVINKITGVFKSYYQVEKVVLYGSRAKGTYKNGSDIDLTMFGDELSDDLLLKIADDLDELLLPYMIDLSIFYHLNNDKLKEHINRVGVVFYEREKALKQGWEIKKLGDVAKISAGNSAPQKKELFESGVYPFFRTSDIGQIRKGIIEFANDYLNEQGVKGLKLFKKGTILLPKSGASTFLNHRVMMKVDGYVSSHLATIKADNNKMVDKFLLYYLTIIDAKDLIQDIAYPSLKVSEISIIPIPIPPLTDQKRIVAILDKVFSAIEQAKQHAKQNLKNAKELFNNYLQSIFINKGDDWEEKTLGDVCDIELGKTPYRDNKNFWDKEKQSNNVWLSISDLSKSENKIVYESEEYITDEAVKISKIVKAGTLLLSFKLTLGRMAFAGRNLFTNEAIAALPIKNNMQLNKYYLYYTLLNLDWNNATENDIKVKGKTLNKAKLKKIEIPIPPLLEQERIVQKLDNLSAQTKQLEEIYQNKLTKLEELKKSILQKAFKGELI